MNRLQHETSPYLLQHAHNPVDWYAWRPEAFERARREQKPILVSIGYSTCHWCHVMERESFEDADVAALMNEFFVNIKVDREERPDVDAIYMEACQIITGAGGWPLNCFLTPEGKPFYAGTYFPPRPAYGRPSWPQLLLHMAQTWSEKREVALEQAERLTGHIRQNDEVLVQGMAPSVSAASHDPAVVFARMRDQFDAQDGGFGGAPKFPGSMAIQFLLNFHAFSGNREALEHAFFSLEKMIHGGIYDQLGGGFARYATDKAWRVPHFEKMLYDNALLVSVLADAYKVASSYAAQQRSEADALQASRRERLFKETIEGTLTFIARDMTSSEGGFYSALDADSEGEEGKYYVWQRGEIQEVLGDRAPLFCAFYDVSPQGNWEGKNILYRQKTYEDYAMHSGNEVESLKQDLLDMRAQLLAVRQQRIAPGLDHKVLLSWNALMASAYASAYTALRHESYREIAVRNVEFLLTHFSNLYDTGSSSLLLRHSLSQEDAFLNDYAYLVAALIDVYEITFEARYLHLASLLLEHTLEAFWDDTGDLFFFTRADQQDLLVRKKDLYDNATPSGNSTMVHNLNRMATHLDQPEWAVTALEMLNKMQATVERFPLSFERWATAFLNQASPAHEIAVVGNNALEKALDLQKMFLPNRVIAAAMHPSEDLPLLKGKTGGEDADIYVCKGYSCQRPVTSLEEFRGLLNL